MALTRAQRFCFVSFGFERSGGPKWSTVHSTDQEFVSSVQMLTPSKFLLLWVEIYHEPDTVFAKLLLTCDLLLCEPCNWI